MQVSHEAMMAAVASLACTATCVLIYMHLQLASILALSDAENKMRFARLEHLIGLSTMHSKSQHKRVPSLHGGLTRVFDAVENPSFASESGCSHKLKHLMARLLDALEHKSCMGRYKTSDVSSQTKRPKLNTFDDSTKLPRQLTADQALSMLDLTTSATCNLPQTLSFIEHGEQILIIVMYAC